MESWEVFRRVIPRGTAAVFARFLRCTPDYVRRWRQPTPDENEDGTGFRNPLDRICDCIDAAFIKNPNEAALFPEFVSEHYRQLVLRHERPRFDGSEARRESVAELLRNSVAAANSLNLEGCTDNTLHELVNFIETGIRIKDKVQAELNSRGGSSNVASLPARLNREGGR